MNEEELLERKSELKRSILTMEWDKKRSQLNFSKNQNLEECKKELESVESKLNQAESS
jgi:hypothetical protein